MAVTLTHSKTPIECHDALPRATLAMRSPASAATRSQHSSVRCLPPKFIIIMSVTAATGLGGFSSMSSSMRTRLSSAAASARCRRMLTTVGSL